MLPREIIHLVGVPALMRVTPALWQMLADDPLTWREAGFMTDAIARVCPEAERLVPHLVVHEPDAFAAADDMLAMIDITAQRIWIVDAATLALRTGLTCPFDLEKGRMRINGPWLLVSTMSNAAVYDLRTNQLAYRLRGPFDSALHLGNGPLVGYIEAHPDLGVWSVHVAWTGVDRRIHEAEGSCMMCFAPSCFCVYVAMAVACYDWDGALIRRVALPMRAVHVRESVLLGRVFYYFWEGRLTAVDMDTGRERVVVESATIVMPRFVSHELGVLIGPHLHFRGCVRPIAPGYMGDLAASAGHVFYKQNTTLVRYKV